MRSRILGVVAGGAVLASVLVTGASPSAAAPPSERVTIVQGPQLERRVGSQAKDQAHMRSYMDSEARSGRLLGSGDVAEYTVKVDGKTKGTIVVPADATVSSVAVAQGTYGAANAEAYGIKMDQPEGQGTGSMGFGYGAVISTKGMYKYGPQGCSDGWWTPNYSSNESAHSFSCFEKWARSGGVEWVYNRWGYFHRAKPSSGWAGTVDYTLRSKPWSGKGADFGTMTNHTPAPSGNSCSGTQTVTLSAGPVSVSIPLTRCSNMQSLAVASSKSGGMDWSGPATTTDLTIDYGIAQNAANKNVVLTWADYTWASTCWATTSASCNPVGNPQHQWNYLKKDAGY